MLRIRSYWIRPHVSFSVSQLHAPMSIQDDVASAARLADYARIPAGFLVTEALMSRDSAQ